MSSFHLLNFTSVIHRLCSSVENEGPGDPVEKTTILKLEETVSGSENLQSDLSTIY
jgi:hypothetical protein